METTVRDARDFGYKVVLVSDGCAAMSVEAHENTLTHMSRTRGNARETDSIVAELCEGKTASTSQAVASVPVGA